ncbi:MAG: substrate-binding domain-containing protein [Anaerolineae bacterium]|nr:substrate-binding domain-containing protein [Anaerolineae bacterium]
MRHLVTLIVLLCSLVVVSGQAAQPLHAAQATAASTSAPRSGDPNRLILATTTSTQDSGLLDYILPDFKKKFNASVDVIAVGTGQALQLGARGDADVVLVHARAQEDAFIKAGDGKLRYDVMYNDFIIVGPADDPAGIKGINSATAAFQKIADKQAPFISRGDESGTHTKEKSIWGKLKVTPKGDWYIAAGQGMGAVLTMAAEQQGYTLSDRATYAARKPNGIALDILVEGDPDLFNPYGVIPVNPDKHPNVNAKLAQAFIDWITSLETQQLIASYQIGGQQMFVPDSAQWRAAKATPAATMAATMQATMAATAQP